MSDGGVTSRPLPRTDGPERPFWEGLLAGEVRVQRCICGHYRFPAARYCGVCHSPQHAWVRVEQYGVVESFCVFHKRYFAGLEVPYAVVQVRLQCGVRFFANMLDVAIDDIRIGMPVTAAFEQATSDVTLLQFRAREIAA